MNTAEPAMNTTTCTYNEYFCCTYKILLYFACTVLPVLFITVPVHLCYTHLTPLYYSLLCLYLYTNAVHVLEILLYLARTINRNSVPVRLCYNYTVVRCPVLHLLLLYCCTLYILLHCACMYAINTAQLLCCTRTVLRLYCAVPNYAGPVYTVPYLNLH